jgi:hypothetical protein
MYGLEIYADQNEENNNQQDIEDDFLEPDVQEAITFRNNLFDQFLNENHAVEEYQTMLDLFHFNGNYITLNYVVIKFWK